MYVFTVYVAVQSVSIYKTTSQNTMKNLRAMYHKLEEAINLSVYYTSACHGALSRRIKFLLERRCYIIAKILNEFVVVLILYPELNNLSIVLSSVGSGFESVQLLFSSRLYIGPIAVATSKNLAHNIIIVYVMHWEHLGTCSLDYIYYVYLYKIFKLVITTHWKLRYAQKEW